MISASVRYEFLATRGERCALGRARTELADDAVGPSVLEHLNIFVANERGEIRRWIRLDPEDLDAAYGVLDALYAAGEGEGPAATWVRDYAATFNRRDWKAARALVAPDCVAADHRLASWGTRHGSDLIEAHRAIVELAPDVRGRVDHVRTKERGFLATGSWVESTTVVEADEDGRAWSAINFDADDYHAIEREAWARWAAIPRGI